MTNQEKIRYLKQYKYLDLKINSLLEEKERLQARAEKVTTVISDMPHGNNGENQREVAICMMIDCEREANQLIDQLCDLRKQIKHYILTTGDNDKNLLVVLETEK